MGRRTNGFWWGIEILWKGLKIRKMIELVQNMKGNRTVFAKTGEMDSEINKASDFE